jgi:GT2 family glycosyltransferase
MINSIELVICTRNRIPTLLQQIKHLSELSEMKDVQLLIVDNSDEDTQGYIELSNVVRNYSSKFSNIKMIKSSPGLVFARNKALENLSSEIIVFIDDDVRLPINFIPTIHASFKKYPEIVGLAPLIEGLYDSQSIFLKNFLRIFAVFQGKITPTSHTFWIYERTKKDRYVDWLPGCCMAYRSSAISETTFSTDLLLGSTGGYSLGEDVDFSSRISRKGRLLCVVDIKIFHDLSEINRSDDQVMQQAIGEWRGYAARKLHRSNYLATFIFELLYVALSRFFSPSRHSRAKIRWHGFRSNRLLPLKIKKNDKEGAS